MTKININSWAFSVALSSLTLPVMADVALQEYYLGAGFGFSELSKGKMNNEITELNRLVDAKEMPDPYEPNFLDSKEIDIFSGDDTFTPTPAKNINKQAVLQDAVEKKWLQQKNNQYALVKTKYSQQFNKAFETLSPISLMDQGFSVNSSQVSYFSALLGSKSFMQEGFFVGLEAQASIFKEKYQEAVGTRVFSAGKQVLNIPQASKIYITNVQNGTGNNQLTKPTLPSKTAASMTKVVSSTTVATMTKANSLSQNSQAKAQFNPMTLTPKYQFTGKEAIIQRLSFKRKMTLSSDLLLGKRFDIKNDISLDCFGLLGYGITSFELKKNGKEKATVIYEANNELKKLATQISSQKTDEQIIKEFATVHQIKIEDKNAIGLRLGAGITLNIDQKYAVSFKIVHANLKGYSLLDNKLKSTDIGLSFQYNF